jgi:hypothetical protein
MERIVQITFLASACALTVVARPATAAVAESDISEFSLGMCAYQHNEFTKAIGHFGCAEPDHFLNPNLHYYLANCMVYLHERDSAIREYRIAYALDPHGSIGNYSKMCLDLFGIDAEGSLNAAAAEKKQSTGDDTVKQKGLVDDGEKILQELKKQKKENSPLYVRNYGPADFAKSTATSNGKSETSAVAANQATNRPSSATKSDKRGAPNVVANNNSGQITKSPTQKNKDSAVKDSSSNKNSGSWFSSVFHLLHGQH